MSAERKEKTAQGFQQRVSRVLEDDSWYHERTSPLGQRAWEPTGILRWVVRIVEVTPGQQFYREQKILQQQWRCCNSGEVKWYDVPTESEIENEEVRSIG